MIKMDIEKIVGNIKKYDYTSIDVDEFLDNRDSREYETGWLNVFRHIDRDAIPEEVKAKSDQLRKEVFLSVDGALGPSELSAYISDDIELLLFADYLKITNDWFEKFIETYENGELPTGVLI